ncbi:hypothetical protein CK506_16290 [Klebsiella pneumoniae]|nr:hypothetical protein CK506_16290 [Klebsiella pneumoniae]
MPSPAPPSPPCSVNLPRIAACALSGVPAAPFVFRVALRLPNLHYPHAHASAAPPGDCRGHGAAFMPGGGLRAVFCKDAASARPEACRDKSKAPRSGDVAGRSPGVQGAAATGRPLCAPCSMRNIT